MLLLASSFNTFSQTKKTSTMKKVLFVLSSASELGTTGIPTGYFHSEAAQAYAPIADAGYEIDFVSPKGGKPPVEATDLKDPINRKFLRDPKITNKLFNSYRPEEINADDYAAIYYVGGHGTTYDFWNNPALDKIALKIWNNGGILSAVCHGPIGFFNLRSPNGEYVVKGKHLVVFTDTEEEKFGAQDVMPFSVAQEIEKRGGILERADDWQQKVVVDGRLITGQNPASAKGVGAAIVEALKTIAQ